MSDAAASDAPVVVVVDASPERLHRLVYARLLSPKNAPLAFARGDTRSDAHVWRAFARSTLFPIAFALAIAAAALALAVVADESGSEVPSLAFVAAGIALAVGGAVAVGKRALVPALVTLAGTGLVIGASVAGVRALRHGDEVLSLVVVIVAVAAVVIARRARPTFTALDEVLYAAPPVPGAAPLMPGELKGAVERVTRPPSAGAIAGSVVIWLASLGIALFALDEIIGRGDAGPAAVVVGLALLGAGGWWSRSPRPRFVVRQLALAGAVVGALWLTGSLLEHLDIGRDASAFIPPVMLVVFALAVASWPLRALAIGSVGIALLYVADELDFGSDIERLDDVFFVLLAAAATFTVLVGRVRRHGYVRPFAVGLALVLLVLSSVELPSVGQDTRLALGTFSGLGLIACIAAVGVVVTHTASKQARALVAGVAVLGGFLLIEAPAVLTAVLLVVLGRAVRVRVLELAGATGLLVALWARVDRPWVDHADAAGALAVAAAVVVVAGFALRRLPADPQR